MPVELLVRLANAASRQLREELCVYLRDPSNFSRGERHVAAGFRYVGREDQIAFSETLYSDAVYRGKVGTYSKAAAEKLRAAISEFEMLSAMHDKYVAAAGAVSTGDKRERVALPVGADEDVRQLRELIEELSANRSELFDALESPPQLPAPTPAKRRRRARRRRKA